jgi:periplasmic mercuric ion binding protein
MKNIIIFFSLLLYSQISVAQQTRKNDKAIITTKIYCDHCSQCETCGKNFQSNMYNIKGVKMYELDTKNMTITVYYNTKKTDLSTIKKAISKMGYDADEEKADTIAYQNLDECCKKKY